MLRFRVALIAAALCGFLLASCGGSSGPAEIPKEPATPVKPSDVGNMSFGSTPKKK